MPIWYLHNPNNIDLSLHIDHQTANIRNVDDGIFAFNTHPTVSVHKKQIAKLRMSDCLVFKQRRELYVALGRPVPNIPRGRPIVSKSTDSTRPVQPAESIDFDEETVQTETVETTPETTPETAPEHKISDPIPIPKKNFNLFDYIF